MIQTNSKAVSLSRPAEKLLLASIAIDKEPAKKANSLAYCPSDYLVTGFPYSKPSELHYSHQVNSSCLTLQGHFKYGLPYGSLPRLAISYIATLAKKLKTQKLELPTITKFCRELDIEPSGGKNGSITQIKKQFLSLFNTSLSITNEYDWTYKGRNFFLIESYELWTSETNNKKHDWNCYVELSNPFYSQIAEHGVPFDFRALKAFKKSPQQMDLYMWLSYRTNSIRKDTLVPWVSLKYQFGQGYADDAQGRHVFRKKLIANLQAVLKVYFDARIKLVDEGLLLQRGKTHVQ